jgi:hypothetical protein
MTEHPLTDYRRWRLGAHYGIHVYAESNDDAPPGVPLIDTPICTAMTVAAAAQIVHDHNARLVLNAPEPDDEVSEPDHDGLEGFGAPTF